MINIKMQPTHVQKLSPKITVIGVGGAGGNAVNNMIASNLEGCEFLVCNTDAQALENSLCETKIQLGAHVTGGLGAGSKPEVGCAAAEESLEEVMQYLDGANMAFVTAGMGGGTGTGAAPVIAKACRDRGILTVGVVTKPFHFEGTHRMRMAEAGIKEMQEYVDTLIVIPNQNLFRVANEKTTFAEAFRMADSVLQSGVRGVTDLMVRPGLVNLDFADIRTAMLEMGKAMMGTGEASGDKRAIEAAEAAINNPLLDDVSMKGAHGVIINVTGGYDMTLFEADEACNRIRDEVDPNANIIFGATFDESMEGRMRVSIVATGIEREADQKSTRAGGGPLGKGVERAQPYAMPRSESAPTYTKPAAFSYAPVQNLRGITAPLPLEPKPAPADPESDLFEQQQFTAQTQDARGRAEIPQNTALRGARYKDSFIPPRPVEPQGGEAAASVHATAVAASYSASYHGRMPAAEERAAPPAQGLQLNPPRAPMPAEQKRRVPSFFERLTGTVQQHLEHARAPEPQQQQRQRMAPMPQAAPRGHASQAAAPAQGMLNIESPAARPRTQAEEELDIPAFLRRQAN